MDPACRVTPLHYIILEPRGHPRAPPPRTARALAMRIVGSLTPNSAAAERVFSLLKLMFGETQISSLADMIQAALMLRYNKRVVG